MTTLLRVRGLDVRHPGGARALCGVDLDLDRGGSLAVIGESGAGKSTLALSLVGLAPGRGGAVTGSVRLDGRELVGAGEAALRAVRGERIALALQGSPFNPVVPLGVSIGEGLRERRGLGRRAAAVRAAELAREVALDPDLLDRYPHEVSGGQRRRAALAAALALDPDLLALDEPTGGLDPVTARDLVDRVRALRVARGFGLLVITHALADAARLADRVAVLYSGQVLESGDAAGVIGDPAHPYTTALVGAYPVMSTTRDLRPLRGTAPDARGRPGGCPFHPRCPQAVPRCGSEPVALAPVPDRLLACHLGGVRTVLHARGVATTYRSRGAPAFALHDVTLGVRAGEAVGLGGPSGSGKSTLARILTGHLEPDAGQVDLDGSPLLVRGRAGRTRRARVQLVLQDPWDALSPRLTVAELVREPLDLLGDPDPERFGRDALSSVGLPTSPAFLAARVHELSGGQLQRVALARALAARPSVLVADEPTSMLDPSEQARLLVTLRERQTGLGLALVLVSHDLALVRKVTDRIVVLDGGRVVETGRTETVCATPRSPTTRRLLDAAPALPRPPEAAGRPPATARGGT